MAHLLMNHRGYTDAPYEPSENMQRFIGGQLDPVHVRSSKVRSIAEEITELESRFRFLEGRNEWLSSKLMRMKKVWADKFLMTNAHVRISRAFACWKDALKELRIEGALEKQTAALNHVQEVTRELGQVLSKEQSARRSVESSGTATLEELKRVQANGEALQSRVDGNASRIMLLSKKLEEAESIIGKSRQNALAAVNQMDSFEQRIKEFRSSAKRAVVVSDSHPSGAIHNSRRIRTVAKDTLQEVSGMLAPQDVLHQAKVVSHQLQSRHADEPSAAGTSVSALLAAASYLGPGTSPQASRSSRLPPALLEEPLQEVWQQQPRLERSVDRAQQDHAEFQQLHEERDRLELERQRREADSQPSSSSHPFQDLLDEGSRFHSAYRSPSPMHAAPQRRPGSASGFARSVSPDRRVPNERRGGGGDKKMHMTTGRAIMPIRHDQSRPAVLVAPPQPVRIAAPAQGVGQSGPAQPWWYGQ